MRTNFFQCTDYSKKSVYIQIILKNLYGLIYKILLGGPHIM